MAQVPRGTRLYIATLFAGTVATTVVSNAAEAVVTASGHTFVNGDYVEITSGWGRLHRRTFRVKGVSGTTFVLEGADTTNTDFYPAGTGIGSARKVSAWTQITKVLDISPSGGGPRNVSYSYLESDIDYSINDGFEANNSTVTLDADAIGTAGYTALQSLTDVQSDTAIRIVARNGSQELLPCTVALNESVQRQSGQINRVQFSVNGNNRATRYAN